MSEWNPRTLCQCVGSDILGWTTGILAIGMLFWYSAIATRWWEAAQASSPASRKVWIWLVAIFAVCTIAGYASLVLALFVPKAAVILRIAFLLLQNIACPVFWHHASSRRFGTMGRNEKIGSELAHAVRNELAAAGKIDSLHADDLNDRQLASLCRRLVAANLERLVTGRLVTGRK